MLGIGNLLMADDGLGVHAVQKLKDFQFPENVEIVDGGTRGLDLLPFLEDKTHIIFIDAINLNKKPGELIILKGDELKSYLNIKFTPHEIGISDLLFSAGLMGILPEEIVLIGLQPYKIEPEIELSDVIKEKLNLLIDEILKILQSWDINLNA